MHGQRRPKASILVVDDDPAVLPIIEAVLDAPDRRIDGVRSRHAAEQLLAAHRYDLVLVDVFLPDTRELELVDAIKAFDLDYPVVLMSGYLDADAPRGSDAAETRDRILTLADRKGVLATLAKPIDTDRLAALADEVLAKRNP